MLFVLLELRILVVIVGLIVKLALIEVGFRGKTVVDSRRIVGDSEIEFILICHCC